jgi:hypothetical protein
MRKFLVPLFTFTLLLGISVPAGAQAVPTRAHVRGHSLIEWQQLFIEWLTTSSANVLFNGGCGEIVEGVYLLPVALGPDTQVECDVPAGTWVLASPGGGFSEIPTWGADDEAVLADLRSIMAQLVSTRTTIDGRVVSGTVAEAGVYDVGPVERMSFFDLACEGLPAPCSVDFQPGDTVRLASAGEMLMLHPMQPGTHTIVMQAEYTFSPEPIQMTATLHVG